MARFPTADAVVADAAGRFVTAAAHAIRETGRFVVALAGGSTPERLYELLSTREYAPRIVDAAAARELDG